MPAARFLPQRRFPPQRTCMPCIAHKSAGASPPPAAMRGGMNIFALAAGRPHHLLFWFCIGNGAFYTGAAAGSVASIGML